MYPSQISTRYALCTHIKYAQYTGVSCFNLLHYWGVFGKRIFSSVICKVIMKTVSQAERSFLAGLDSRHALAWAAERAEERLRGRGQLLTGVKNSRQKQHLSTVGAAWELDRWK